MIFNILKTFGGLEFGCILCYLFQPNAYPTKLKSWVSTEREQQERSCSKQAETASEEYNFQTPGEIKGFFFFFSWLTIMMPLDI